MAKSSSSRNFEIWQIPEQADPVENQANQSRMTRFPRRCKEKSAAQPPTTTTPENAKPSCQLPPKAPVKPRRKTGKKTVLGAVPRSLQFSEAEDENEPADCRETRGQKMAAQRSENEKIPPATNARAKPGPKSRKKLLQTEMDKENDSRAANRVEPQLRESGARSNKTRSLLSVNNNPATARQEPNLIEQQLSVSSIEDPIECVRQLQQERDIGLWIQCCRKTCHKWRYVEQYHDPVDVPEVWYCEMNSDPNFADCSIAEEEISDAEAKSEIENAYNAGSIVWARLNGFPWWPAMVDDCTVLLRYYDVRGSSRVPYRYNVTWFNEKAVQHNWIPVKDLKPFVKNPPSTFPKKTVFRGKNYREELNDACALAEQALPLSISERLRRYSFVSRLYGNDDNQPKNNKRAGSLVQAESQTAKKPKQRPSTSRSKPANNSQRDEGNETMESVDAATTSSSNNSRHEETEVEIVASVDDPSDSDVNQSDAGNETLASVDAAPSDLDENQQQRHEARITPVLTFKDNQWFIDRSNGRVLFDPNFEMPPLESMTMLEIFECPYKNRHPTDEEQPTPMSISESDDSPNLVDLVPDDSTTVNNRSSSVRSPDFFFNSTGPVAAPRVRSDSDQSLPTFPSSDYNQFDADPDMEFSSFSSAASDQSRTSSFSFGQVNPIFGSPSFNGDEGIRWGIPALSHQLPIAAPRKMTNNFQFEPRFRSVCSSIEVITID